jgi:hypothetical protein
MDFIMELYISLSAMGTYHNDKHSVTRLIWILGLKSKRSFDQSKDLFITWLATGLLL